MSERFTFTVFTPTYNRRHVLHRVWESLIAQTRRDFEWLIIDDGSGDGTKELVERWQADAATWFPIRYIWQQNQHKKVAHNRALMEAAGEFILVFDSDDRCIPTALERFYHYWTSIPEDSRSGFSGVCGLCVDLRWGLDFCGGSQAFSVLLADSKRTTRFGRLLAGQLVRQTACSLFIALVYRYVIPRSLH